MPGNSEQARLIIWPEIVERIGDARAQQIFSIMQNDTLEIIDHEQTGLPIEIKKSKRLIDDIANAEPNEDIKFEIKQAARKLELASRGVIQDQEGYKIVQNDGTAEFPKKKLSPSDSLS